MLGRNYKNRMCNTVVMREVSASSPCNSAACYESLHSFHLDHVSYSCPRNTVMENRFTMDGEIFTSFQTLFEIVFFPLEPKRNFFTRFFLLI